ncbi:MAG: hypothetical protein PUE51_09695 [Veillonellaceae bacterium]|nr:hypothetical protein [Veillonellaceae bacterium]MDD6698602.1 hypothetical protein [Veillonellaceae bacterium]
MAQMTDALDDQVVKKIMWKVIYIERKLIEKDEKSVTEAVRQHVKTIKEFVDENQNHES